MVSSKFSRTAHAFRVPAVCKDKLKKVPVAPPTPPGPPLPGELLQNDYVFHGVYFGFNYDYEGNIHMPRTLPNKWNSSWPVPEDDVYSEFLFNWMFHNWFATFWINPLLGPTINFNSAPFHYDEDGEFDTGVFNYARAGYIGIATGRITNVV